MVKRDGDTNPVSRRILQSFSDKEPVIEDIDVRERSALGEAGGPGGVLDVDGVVGLEQRLALLKLLRAGPGRVREQALPARLQLDDLAQVRALRAHALDHAGEVAGAEGARVDEH